MASKRVNKLCESISRMLEEVASGHTLRAAEQVGPDAVTVRRTGLRGDADPGITIEIMPDSPLPAEESKYAPLLTDEETEEHNNEPDDKDDTQERHVEDVQDQPRRRATR